MHENDKHHNESFTYRLKLLKRNVRGAVSLAPKTETPSFWCGVRSSYHSLRATPKQSGFVRFSPSFHLKNMIVLAARLQVCRSDGQHVCCHRNDACMRHHCFRSAHNQRCSHDLCCTSQRILFVRQAGSNHASSGTAAWAALRMEVHCCACRVNNHRYAICCRHALHFSLQRDPCGGLRCQGSHQRVGQKVRLRLSFTPQSNVFPQHVAPFHAQSCEHCFASLAQILATDGYSHRNPFPGPHPQAARLHWQGTPSQPAATVIWVAPVHRPKLSVSAYIGCLTSLMLNCRLSVAVRRRQMLWAPAGCGPLLLTWLAATSIVKHVPLCQCLAQVPVQWACKSAGIMLGDVQMRRPMRFRKHEIDHCSCDFRFQSWCSTPAMQTRDRCAAAIPPSSRSVLSATSEEQLLVPPGNAPCHLLDQDGACQCTH